MEEFVARVFSGGKVTVPKRLRDLFEEQERNRRWFEQSFRGLMKEYDGMFVAIYNEKVVE